RSAAADVPDADIGAASRSRSGNDVGNAIAVDIAQGHAHASPEVRVIGVEVGNRLVRDLIEDLDLRPSSGISSNHQLRMGRTRRAHAVAGKGIVRLSIDAVVGLVHWGSGEVKQVRPEGQGVNAGLRLSREGDHEDLGRGDLCHGDRVEWNIAVWPMEDSEGK